MLKKVWIRHFWTEKKRWQEATESWSLNFDCWLNLWFNQLFCCHGQSVSVQLCICLNNSHTSPKPAGFNTLLIKMHECAFQLWLIVDFKGYVDLMTVYLKMETIFLNLMYRNNSVKGIALYVDSWTWRKRLYYYYMSCKQNFTNNTILWSVIVLFLLVKYFLMHAFPPKNLISENMAFGFIRL